ncbi:MAG: O-antigen ligase family protein [Patescibacteria group bacterium]
MIITKYEKTPFSGRTIFDRLLEIGFLVALFLVPLCFATIFKSYNIFNLNKIVLFRIILSLIFFITVAREIFYPSNLLSQITNFFKKYWLYPSIFIFLLGISLLFSENIALSFFGAINQQQGYLSYLFYFSWFILFSFNLAVSKERESETKKIGEFDRSIKRLVLAIVFSGTLASLYGILQLMGIDPYTWTEAANITKRAASTLGNPNFFASWILLVVPLAFYLFYLAPNNFIKKIYFLLFLFNLAGLFSTGSRAGLLALFFALIVFFIYLLSFYKLSFKKIVVIIFFFFLFSVGSLAAFNYIIPGRISSMFNLKAEDVGERFDFYTASLSAIKQKPFFGYGQENLTSIFISYYRPDWGLRQINQVPDRAHNLILDILMFGGLCALTAFSLLFFYFFHLAYKNIRNNNQPELSLALALGVSAYLFSLLFGFSIPSGEIYVFSFLGVLVACNFTEQTINKKIILGKSWRYFLLTIIFVVSFWSIYKSTEILLADHYFAKAVLAWKEEKYDVGMSFLKRIDKLKINVVNQAFYDSYSIDAILSAYPLIKDSVIQKDFEERIEKLSQSIPEKEPYTIITKAKAKAALGDFVEAEKLLSTLEEKASFWPGVYIEKAKLNILLGNTEMAIQFYKMALENMPDFNGSYSGFHYVVFYSLAELYEKGGDLTLAKEYYDLAFKAKPQSPILTYPQK